MPRKNEEGLVVLEMIVKLSSEGVEYAHEKREDRLWGPRWRTVLQWA